MDGALGSILVMIVVFMGLSVPTETTLSMPISRRKLHMSRLLCVWLAVIAMLSSAAVGALLGAPREYIAGIMETLATLLCRYIAITSALVMLSYRLAHAGYKGLAIIFVLTMALSIGAAIVDREQMLPRGWVAGFALLVAGVFTLLGLRSIEKYEVVPHGTKTAEEPTATHTRSVHTLGYIDSFRPVFRIALRHVWLNPLYILLPVLFSFQGIVSLHTILVSHGPLNLFSLQYALTFPIMVGIFSRMAWGTAPKLLATGMSKRTVFRVIALPWLTIFALLILVISGVSITSRYVHGDVHENTAAPVNIRPDFFSTVPPTLCPPPTPVPYVTLNGRQDKVTPPNANACDLPQVMNSDDIEHDLVLPPPVYVPSKYMGAFNELPRSLLSTSPHAVTILCLPWFAAILLAIWIGIPIPGWWRKIAAYGFFGGIILSSVGGLAIVSYAPHNTPFINATNLPLKPLILHCRAFFWPLLAVGLGLCIGLWRLAERAFDYAELDGLVHAQRKARASSPFARWRSSSTT